MKKSIFILFLFSSVSLLSQKLKYKDIFTVIQSKSYVEAEKQLKQYLSDPKNGDEANAWYQLGLIFEMKALEKDVLTDSANFSALADSAIQNLNTSSGLITEKEVKRNEEYYQAFYRRDLRTAEFGIKVSDVKLDIEQRINALETKRTKMRRLHEVLALLQVSEKNTMNKYNEWTSKYKNYNDFVLRGGPEELQLLSDISIKVSDFQELASELKTLSSELSLSSYREDVKFKRIIGFKQLENLLDVKSGKIEVWDVQGSVDDARKDLTGDVASYKSLIKENDKLQEEITQKLLAKEKVNVITSLPKTLETYVNRYDPEGAPISLIKARIAQNIALTLLNTETESSFRDTLQMGKNLVISDSLVFLLSRMNQYLFGIKDKVKDQQSYYASFYFERYKGEPILLEKIDELISWNEQEMKTWKGHRSFWDFQANYGISLTDTLELKISDETSSGVWYTQKIYSKGDSIILLGIRQDTLLGFTKIYNGLHKQIGQSISALPFSYKDSLGQIIIQCDTLMTKEILLIYTFTTDTTSSPNLLLTALAKDGKSLWLTTTTLTEPPKYATYDSKSKVTTVYFFPSEMYPLPNNEKGYLIIDGKGKIK